MSDLSVKISAEKKMTNLFIFKSGVDKDFKAVVQKISSKDHLKRNLAFATVELGHSRDIFTLVSNLFIEQHTNKKTPLIL